MERREGEEGDGRKKREGAQGEKVEREKNKREDKGE